MHEKSLDVLSHQITGMVMENENSNINDVFFIVKNAYPFRNITKEELVECVIFLQKHGIIGFNGEKIRLSQIEQKARNELTEFQMIKGAEKQPIFMSMVNQIKTLLKLYLHKAQHNFTFLLSNLVKPSFFVFIIMHY